MTGTRLKIAFLTSTNVRDKHAWSGIHYYMARALERNVGEVNCLGPVDLKFHIHKGRVLSFLSQKLVDKRFDYTHSFSVAKEYAKVFSEKLKNKKYDLIFAPASSSEIAFLETKIPIVYLSDTTFANMVDYYPAYSKLTKKSLLQGHEIERRAITNAKFALYPSEWAANSALKDYNADKSKVHVIPMGANIDEPPPCEKVLKKIKTGKCCLLFLGVNWERKGGEVAFDCMVKMNDMGIETLLTVCGCIPPKKFSHTKMKVIPFINKNDKEQYKQFENLLLNSDFLILPTKAECYGIVFCEASAYGLPSIVNDTGGVSGAVTNGKNGFLLPSNSTGNDYAKLIADVFRNDEKYDSLVKSSRNIFEMKLNWDAWAKKVKNLLLVIQK